MKWYNPNKLEWVSFFTLMPFLATGANYLLFGDRFLTTEVLVKSNLVIYSVALLSWYTHVSLTYRINTRFWHYTDANKRAIWLLVVHIFVMALSHAVYFFGYDYFDFLDYKLNLEKYIWATIAAFFVTSLATTIWTFKHAVNKLKQGLVEKEELEEENLIAEIEGLRNQVNPHFLFNCLNSISALMEDESEKAESFVDEMSKVYRYLLQTTDRGLAELSAELDFIRSYFYLLTIRHADSLSFRIQVEREFFNRLLPIHTLQVLVENALKHNVLDRSSPLLITIATSTNGKLIVSNNIQRKTLRVYASGRIGLDNIRNKYRLLNVEDISIRRDNNRFVVELPLITRQALSRLSLDD